MYQYNNTEGCGRLDVDKFLAKIHWHVLVYNVRSYMYTNIYWRHVVTSLWWWLFILETCRSLFMFMDNLLLYCCLLLLCWNNNVRRIARDRQTATVKHEISTVWKTKPRATPQMTCRLLMWPELVTWPKTLQAISLICHNTVTTKKFAIFQEKRLKGFEVL